MAMPETIKSTETWGCPLCKRGMTMRTEGTLKGSLRPHNAGGAGIAPQGLPCPGAGFSPYRPAFPQEVRLYGLAEAIGRVRHGHGKPDWVPEPMHPGDLQEFVWAAWPQADRFEMAPLTGERRGVTFTIGSKRWYFVAHDSFISQEYTSRADASDALFEYLKGN